jgi:hypothetical protein
VENVRKECVDGGSGSLTLVLVHPEVKLGYWSRARSAQAKESLSCESE